MIIQDVFVLICLSVWFGGRGAASCPGVKVGHCPAKRTVLSTSQWLKHLKDE